MYLERNLNYHGTYTCASLSSDFSFSRNTATLSPASLAYHNLLWQIIRPTFDARLSVIRGVYQTSVWSLILHADRLAREIPKERSTEMTLCTAAGPLDAGTCTSDSQDQYNIAHVPAWPNLRFCAVWMHLHRANSRSSTAPLGSGERRASQPGLDASSWMHYALSQ